MPRAAELRTTTEKTLFGVSFAFSLIAWIGIIVSILGLFYGLLIGLFLFIAHALMIARIKGNGVRISAAQFPDLHRRVTEAAHKLGFDKAPDAYVMQAGGALNAFATKFFGRNFMVIYSDLLEACDDTSKEIDMIIGHEIGHLALGHLKWIWFLIPAKVVPWLGPAYSRACEYSCDLCGYEAVGELGGATRGLAILAAGGKYGRQVNLDAYMQQAKDTSGFWTSVYELNASHPYLTKRIAAVMNHAKPGTVPDVGRHMLAYPLAPMFNFASAGGSGVLVMVAIIGILAAIAIPQYSKFRAAAQQKAVNSAEESRSATESAVDPGSTMDATLESISTAAKNYRADKAVWPCTLEELNFPEMTTYAQSMGWALEVSCNPVLGAIVYDKDGKRAYRAIYFETGKIEDGVL